MNRQIPQIEQRFVEILDGHEDEITLHKSTMSLPGLFTPSFSVCPASDLAIAEEKPQVQKADLSYRVALYSIHLTG